MNDLVERIRNLSSEQALEAAQFLSKSVAPQPANAPDATSALAPLIKQPYKNLPQIEQRARLLLLTAAVTSEYHEEARKAVDGAGKKQFILGGAEIVLLAMVGLGALQTILAKGKVSETTKINVTPGKDGGDVTISGEKTIVYGVGIDLAAILKASFGGPATMVAPK